MRNWPRSATVGRGSVTSCPSGPRRESSRGHELHEFLTTPRSAGAGRAFAALLADILADGAVGERCLDEASPGLIVASPAPRVPLTRVQALAKVYQSIMAPGAAVSRRSPADADGRLNHDSFVFAL